MTAIDPRPHVHLTDEHHEALHLAELTRAQGEDAPTCPCGEWNPSATLDEAELLHAAHRAAHGHEEWTADYFQCRHQAWHWIPAIAYAQCPCRRPAYASDSDRNRAARREAAVHGTEAIRTRPLTCRHGGHHYTWAPAGTAVKHCRCGAVRFEGQDAAEATAEHYRSMDPLATVTVYECWRPGWHVRVDGLGAEHHPQLPPVNRCRCGKAASDTEEQAQALHTLVAAHTGTDQSEVRYYACHHGSWHWTKRVTYEVCACGCTVYADAAEATRAARQAARRLPSEDLEARAYQCRHGGNHWTWYPAGTTLTSCYCGQVRYPSKASAEAVVAFRSEHNPVKWWQVVSCAGGWHVTHRSARRSAAPSGPPAGLLAVAAAR